MAGFLMVAMIGCGDANIDREKLGETSANADEDTKKQGEDAAAGEEGQPPDGGGGDPARGAGGTGTEDPNTPNP